MPAREMKRVLDPASRCCSPSPACSPGPQPPPTPLRRPPCACRRSTTRSWSASTPPGSRAACARSCSPSELRGRGRRPLPLDARGWVLRARVAGRLTVRRARQALLPRRPAMHAWSAGENLLYNTAAIDAADGDRGVARLTRPPRQHARPGVARGRHRLAPRELCRRHVRRRADLGDHDGLRHPRPAAAKAAAVEAATAKPRTAAVGAREGAGRRSRRRSQSPTRPSKRDRRSSAASPARTRSGSTGRRRQRRARPTGSRSRGSTASDEPLEPRLLPTTPMRTTRPSRRANGLDDDTAVAGTSRARRHARARSSCPRSRPPGGGPQGVGHRGIHDLILGRIRHAPHPPSEAGAVAAAVEVQGAGGRVPNSTAEVAGRRHNLLRRPKRAGTSSRRS